MRNAKRSVFMIKIINAEREAFRVHDTDKDYMEREAFRVRNAKRSVIRNAKRSVFMPKIINAEREAFRVHAFIRL